MRKRLHGASGVGNVDMTPMLDIVFILLIFFIVTATFLQEEGLQMMPPSRAETPPIEPPRSILVQIDGGDAVYVNGRLTDQDRVTAAIQRQNADNGGRSAVIIQPNAESEHGVVTRAYDSARAARVVDVVVSPPERTGD